MKIMQFVIFFSIFFIIYGLVNYYIFIRGWQALPQHSKMRIPYLVVFLLISLSFIAGRIIERFWLGTFSKTVVFIGAFWLGAMLYFFLIVLILDIARFVNHFLPYIHHLSADYAKVKLTGFYLAIGTVAVVLIAGHFNALYPRVRQFDIHIPKQSDVKQLKAVAATDIHLGTIIGRDRFCSIVNKINELEPDIVLLGGDIVDEDLKPVIQENLGDAVTQIKTKYGIYAITGNHEYIGGVEAAVKYMEDHNVRVLQDEALILNESIYLVGREDISIDRFTDKKRKSLAEIMQNVDKSRPVLLMDHQPFNLNQAIENGIDFQLSGHTHHGQLFPLNLVTKAIYEISWGYRKIQNTQFYVSCGVGTWGPPMRIGNRPELVVFNFSFE
ncbi:metallophosphoesterase [candidate division KSB1 bacterium]|nr:metallophosphoesterase [candidate division KSB1 bacterium]